MSSDSSTPVSLNIFNSYNQKLLIYEYVKIYQIIGNGMPMLPVNIFIVDDLWLEPLPTHLAWCILLQKKNLSQRLNLNPSPPKRQLNGGVPAMKYLNPSKTHPSKHYCIIKNFLQKFLFDIFLMMKLPIDTFLVKLELLHKVPLIFYF